VDELACWQRTPEQAFADAWQTSRPLIFTIHVDGVPSALFGAAEVSDSSEGSVWMLGTDRLLVSPRELIVESRLWIQFLAGFFDGLTNWVSAHNSVSIRWLEAMGFTFPGDVIISLTGTPFRKFTLCANLSQ